MNSHITAYPLTWPQGWKRVHLKIWSNFSRNNKKVTIGYATEFVLHELNLMSVSYHDVIISSDLRLRQDGLPYSVQRKPDDVGVSVWWMKGKTQQVIALDRYDLIADNLYAIGKTIEAMRGINRWGGGEILNRTFTGFVAITHETSDWREILGNALTLEEAKAAFKKKRSEHHPDKGGNSEQFNKVTLAWVDAQREFNEGA